MGVPAAKGYTVESGERGRGMSSIPFAEVGLEVVTQTILKGQLAVTFQLSGAKKARRGHPNG